MPRIGDDYFGTMSILSCGCSTATAHIRPCADAHPTRSPWTELPPASRGDGNRDTAWIRAELALAMPERMSAAEIGGPRHGILSLLASPDRHGLAPLQWVSMAAWAERSAAAVHPLTTCENGAKINALTAHTTAWRDSP